jgi:hypothetical protein
MFLVLTKLSNDCHRNKHYIFRFHSMAGFREARNYPHMLSTYYITGYPSPSALSGHLQAQLIGKK